MPAYMYVPDVPRRRRLGALLMFFCAASAGTVGLLPLEGGPPLGV